MSSGTAPGLPSWNRPQPGGFALQDGVVHHTYSTYDRGTEALNATWQLLDRAPRGRDEDFSDWPRKRDEYARQLGYLVGIGL